MGSKEGTSSGLSLGCRAGGRIYLIHEETGDVITLTAGTGPYAHSWIRLGIKAGSKWRILREEFLLDGDKPGLGPEFEKTKDQRTKASKSKRAGDRKVSRAPLPATGSGSP